MRWYSRIYSFLLQHCMICRAGGENCRSRHTAWNSIRNFDVIFLTSFWFPKLVIVWTQMWILQQIFQWRGNARVGLTPKLRAPTVGKRRHVTTLNVTHGHSETFVFKRQFEQQKIISEINCGWERNRVNIFFYNCSELIAAIKGKRAPSLWDLLNCVILY